MFYGQDNINEIPKINTINAENIYKMYAHTSFSQYPDILSENIKYAYMTFFNCSNLSIMPNINLNNAINIQSMFDYCTNLENFGTQNLSHCEEADCLFEGCLKLKEVPNWNFTGSNVKNMTFLFCECSNLQYVNNLMNINIDTVEETL
ncbi:MAG: BspA family leucine-rich repeat surface protein [Bacilli bacterium]